MKRVSAKQLKANRERALWAAPWVQSVGRCMICGGTLWLRRKDGQVIAGLHCHEMIRGTAGRARSVEAGEILCLVACNLCHAGPLDDAKEMPLARQIAHKVVFEQQRLCLGEFWAIGRASEIIRAVRSAKDNGRSPVIVRLEEVLAEIARMRT